MLFQKGLFGLSVVPAVLFDGFTLQFVPAGLDHCVQHNLPLMALPQPLLDVCWGPERLVEDKVSWSISAIA